MKFDCTIPPPRSHVLRRVEGPDSSSPVTGSTRNGTEAGKRIETSTMNVTKGSTAIPSWISSVAMPAEGRRYPSFQSFRPFTTSLGSAVHSCQDSVILGDFLAKLAQLQRLLQCQQ
ncbi:hypothetical protein KIL84_005069 [Mauremys mutica]|uniref:Uncharacterized protein n=1 Tax=Mauremys mutica TaxID=74926 RepID=A0A9D3XL79_9SAUR|nr:hypothetical protein KIL84_005069 [Mauremys mutica]